MTLAPRVQVYTQLSCNAIYGHDKYDHTNTRDNISMLSSSYQHVPYHIDPAGPSINHLDLNYILSDNTHSTSLDSGDDEEPDPRMEPTERCLKDPAVQKGAARIQTIMTTTMGVLSALTTGWWGHFADQHGRTRVLAAATFGLLLTYVIYFSHRVIRTDALSHSET